MYIKKSVYKSYPEIHEEIIQGKFLPHLQSHRRTMGIFAAEKRINKKAET